MNALNVMRLRASVEHTNASALESLERIDLQPIRTLGELVLLKELYAQLAAMIDADLQCELRKLTGGNA